MTPDILAYWYAHITIAHQLLNDYVNADKRVKIIDEISYCLELETLIILCANFQCTDLGQCGNYHYNIFNMTQEQEIMLSN